MTRPDTPNSRHYYSPCSSSFSEHSYYTTNENDSTFILEENLADSIHTDVDLLEFLKVISGLDRTVSERVLKLPFSLDVPELNCYKTAAQVSLRQASLAAIMQKLLHAVQEDLSIQSEYDDPFLIHVVWHPTCGDKSAMVTTCGSPGTGSTLINWPTAKVILEMLHQAELASVAPGPILASCGGAVTSPSPLTRAQASTQSNNPSLLAAKRRRSVSVDSTLDEHIKKRQCIVDHKVEETPTGVSFLQLASLARTYLASTTRLWVSGLVVDKDCKITAAYYDRQLVVYSAPFHFDEEPVKLALLVYAMSFGCIQARKADLNQHPLASRDFPVTEPRANVMELGTSFRHPTNHKPRTLRIIAAPYYHKLWEAGSVENLQKVWLDCVNGRREVWQRSGTLHQDLSETTLQVLHLNGETQGILKDWDTSLTPQVPARLSPTYIPAGTPTFMAAELLSPFDPDLIPYIPAHWYRHNLEAFFYILAWAAVHYNMELKTRDDDVHPSLELWASNDDFHDASYNKQSNADSKLTFVVPGNTAPARALRFIRRKPGFRERLLEEWILPLCRLLRKARRSFEDGVVGSETQKQAMYEYDYSTCGGELTFETFMATLGIQVQK
ncbi:hypothetical protein DFP72DRAFT_1099897 [Ephemerocybe angulata]|uniref:Fungal-type protein kinase domain-containing protein n=1 Tax=Ephemerocybe angulata TaxID=980116 RepID=A0A8H6LTP1_9AGAR|nr:hypothetical protein DFP72DRAFT_1099897 [Tulosesus angulatus]